MQKPQIKNWSNTKRKWAKSSTPEQGDDKKKLYRKKLMKLTESALDRRNKSRECVENGWAQNSSACLT